MTTAKRCSPEFRERAVRMLREHRREYPFEWATMGPIAEKPGCKTETLRQWVRAQREQAALGSDLGDDERENRELRRTNEILRKASAFFAQAELDRHEK